MSEVFSPVVYRVTETDLEGNVVTHERGWDALTAGHNVNRAIRKADEAIVRGEEPGYRVDPATDATGRLVISRRHLDFSGPDQVRERWRTWVLEPVARPKLSDAMADDLQAVQDSTHHPRDNFHAPEVRGGSLRRVKVGAATQERIRCSGMYSIPPAAWRRLVDKGWAYLLTGRVEPMTPFRVSVAGTVALTLREHQTRTSSPLGYIYASDHPNREIARSGAIGPWRKGGRIHDGTSWAVCSAGCLKGRCLDRRNLAQGVTREHRAEMVMLALGASAEQAARAGRRALHTPRGVAA
jgi:hypothetical protein